MTNPDAEKLVSWQMIENAPKTEDMTGQFGICVAYSYGSRWAFHHAWWDDAVGEWTDIYSDRYILRPTHWAPLPFKEPTTPAQGGD